MKTLTPNISRRLLNAAVEYDWKRFQQDLQTTEAMIGFTDLHRHPEAEEAIRLALDHGDSDLLRLIITRDFEFVSASPDLKGLNEVSDDALRVYAGHAALRAMVGLAKHTIDTIEADPHCDSSHLLIRLGKFPVVLEEFGTVMRRTLFASLKFASILGLKTTIQSLRKLHEPIHNDAIAALVHVLEFHPKADILWRHGLISVFLLQEIRQIARINRYPQESLDWLDRHIREGFGRGDDDEEVPF